MSDIRKRSGLKGTTYQVRYPSKTTKSGYAYATFATLKEARAFREDSSALRAPPSRATPNSRQSSRLSNAGLTYANMRVGVAAYAGG
jgi:hypothetical protein